MIRSFTDKEIEFLKSRNLNYKITNEDDVSDLDIELGELLDKEEFNKKQHDNQLLDMIYTILYNIDETPEKYRTRNVII
ncbi:hypothetical protein [Oceanivirga salmonicida]|uniref:hypothetical protein n=1 Tax=Oceanivirga salmonicida TaxID=1769291 RepID=UPI00082DA42E|nr:hypothetical protein [Oceanivirga salmonicida]